MGYPQRLLMLTVVLFVSGCVADSEWGRSQHISKIEKQMVEQGVDKAVVAGQLLLEANSARMVGNAYLAIDYIKRAKYYTPESPVVWFQLAQLYLQQARYKEAEASALRIIRFSKNSTQMQAKGWRLIEQSRLLLGREDRAVYAGIRATELEREQVFFKN
ncbi:MAG: hypothetical protein L3J62_11890 [Gammaproteobacteria bacterium]|nr:hypothetical protein [Gammaproteobacteria bacterium]MCF6231457.1 hypothetical protein [Gammaproteobacteria bacterium]